jgi:hypothetical protein
MPGNGNEPLVRMEMPNRHTKEIRNIEGFEGVGTLLHQRRCQHGVFHTRPRQPELPEVDTAWQGQ